MSSKVICESPADRRNFLMFVGLSGAVLGVLPFARTVSAIELHDHAVSFSRIAAKEQPRTAKTSQTAAALRDLWVGHIFWVRNVSLAAFHKDDAAMKAAEQQVVANAKSIAATIEPFYGTAAKEGFF